MSTSALLALTHGKEVIKIAKKTYNFIKKHPFAFLPLFLFPIAAGGYVYRKELKIDQLGTQMNSHPNLSGIAIFTLALGLIFGGKKLYENYRNNAFDEMPIDTIVQELKGFWTSKNIDGDQCKVMQNPKKTLIYFVALNVFGAFLGLLYPFLGYSLIGISIGVIIKPIHLRFKDFFRNLQHQIGWLNHLMKYFQVQQQTQANLGFFYDYI